MRLLKVLALTLLLAPACRADDSLALANKLIDLANTKASIQNGFEMSFRPALDRLKSAGAPQELIDQVQALLTQFFADNFKWDIIQPQLAQLYVKDFTAKELADIVAFEESPAGKKFTATMPSILRDSSAIVQTQFKDKIPEFQMKAAALIKDYQSKHPPVGLPPAPAAPTGQ